MLALDHVFCMVETPGEAAARALASAGWTLDAGSRHPGQGTRNRRLGLAEHYFELLWVEDEAEARANPLRLDRRAGWAHTGASPFGIAFRGPPPSDDYWLYDGLGIPIWVRRDRDERPLVFTLDVPARPPRPGVPALHAVRLRGPAAPSLPPYEGPPIEHVPGTPRLELVAGDGPNLHVNDMLVVGGGGDPPLDGPVVLCEYDPSWPELYAREQERIRGALGDRALVLEHVGSTSVPGLVAKPRIDVLLVVADSADERAYFPALEAAGYVLYHREVDWHQHRLLRGPGTPINLHVFGRGCVEAERLLAFRDRLRADAADREAYAAAKRELAARRWRVTQDYADAKSGIVEAILRRSSAHQSSASAAGSRSDAPVASS